MALIPNDIGIRMRLETEAQLVSPLRPAAGIPSDVLNLRIGERFSARIQEVLPDNTYKALVAGKSLTLSLPQGAQAGDTLELVVIDRSPKAVLAHLSPSTDTADTKTAHPYPFATLSRAGQLISTLLPAEGESAVPLSLNRGQSLIAQPAISGSPASVTLAPLLADAIKHSGMFYESQQAQWVTGQLSLEQLVKNPQAQHSDPATLMSAHALLNELDTVSSGAQESALAGRREAPASLLQAFLGRDGSVSTEAGNNAIGQDTRSSTGLNPLGNSNPASSSGSTSAASSANTTSAPGTTGASIPDDLKPIVQQQLEALATQRLAWHGEVWPNQHMQWEIDWQQRSEAGDDEDDKAWNTTLSLSTPRLGELHARLQLIQGGVRIVIATPTGASAADLREASPLLEQALGAVGVPLLGFSVKHDVPSMHHVDDADPAHTETGGRSVDEDL